MYKVEIYHEGSSDKYTILDLPNDINALLSATLDKQEDNIDALTINIIDSFLKENNFKIDPYKTLIKVTNTKKNKIEFKGRILAPESDMNESGVFSHNLVFEGVEAYLKDTIQKYSFEFDKMPVDNLKLVLDFHNAELPNEPYKHFKIGTVNVEKNVIPNDGGYHEEEKYFKRWEDKDTHQTLQDDLKGKYGGTFIFEPTDGPTIVHWLKETGVKKATEIKLGKNLKNIQYRVDPSEIITRVKPLGVASETANGDEIRLTIEDVNNGSKYIDIPELIAIYGIQTGVVDFPDKYTPITLKEATLTWIQEQYQNLAKVSISLSAVDLSIIGVDPDDFDLFNIHRTICPPLKIDEDLKVVGINIDLINPQSKGITIGEKKLTIAQLQLQQTINVTNTIINNTVPSIIEKEVVPMIDEKVPQIIAENTKTVFDAQKDNINQYVIDKINSSTNVIRGDALQVDAALVNKLSGDQAFLNQLVATDIVTQKIQTTSIDLNKATITGSEDSNNYIVLTNDEIKQYGTYDTVEADGRTITHSAFAQLKNAYLRFRDNGTGKSIYYAKDRITSNINNSLTATTEIRFFNGIGLYSSTGAIGINAQNNTASIYGGKGVDIDSESSMRLYSFMNLDVTADNGKMNFDSEMTMDFTSQSGAIHFSPHLVTTTGDNNFELWIKSNDAASLTDGCFLFGNILGDNSVGSGIRFYKNGATVEATNHKGDKGTGKFRGTAFENSSYVEYKQDITKWEFDALNVIMNEVELYQYKYKSDIEHFHRGVIIGDGYKTPVEFIHNEAVDLYEMISWSLRSIQQLGTKDIELENRLKVLEDKINGTESTTNTA